MGDKSDKSGDSKSGKKNKHEHADDPYGSGHGMGSGNGMADATLTDGVVIEEIVIEAAGDGGIDRTRVLGLTIGTARVAIGASLLAAPAFAGRVWLGDGASSHPAKVLARAVGARDLALGLATLGALRGRRSTAQLLKLGFVADLADAVASGLSWRDLDRSRRVAVPAIAGLAGVIGLLGVTGSEIADELADADAATNTSTDMGRTGRVEGGPGSSADVHSSAVRSPS